MKFGEKKQRKREDEVWRKETKESSTFYLQNTVTNLTKGTIEVLNGSDKISEKLYLVFSVSMLQVLCVPRPAKWKPGQDVSGKKSRGSMGVISPEDMPFVMATGLLVRGPTNQYIRETSSAGYTTGGCEFESDVVCEFGGDGDVSGGCGGCSGCCSGGGGGGGFSHTIGGGCGCGCGAGCGGC